MSTVAISPIRRSEPRTTSRPRKTKGGYTRQRRGCLTCRRRKKKCDQSLPVCGHCSRLNLVCTHEEPQLLQAFRSSQKAEPDPGASPASEPCSNSNYAAPARGSHLSEMSRLARVCETLDLVHPFSGDGQDLSASRRSMMRYYTTTLAIMLSATGENNYFLSVMLPMAFDCPTLLDALSAWSSAHLALRYPDFRYASLQHRGRTLAGLGAAIKSNSMSNEMCLAVAMAMCSMETISEATSRGWADHLAGAAEALQSKSSQVNSSDTRLDDEWLRSFEGKWLLRNFAYHDILMSVSLDRRPFRTGDYWMSTDDSIADPYFGLASRILFFISEISVLNADCADRIASSSQDGFSPGAFPTMDESQEWENDTLLHRARSLAKDLQEWICPPAKAEEGSLAYLSETYRGAALIYLDRVLRKYFPCNVVEILPKGVGVYITSICETAQKVPEGSLAECSLLFPLFIAGGEAENPEHINSIRHRLCVMNTWRKFRNVDACREVLEIVWRHRLAESHDGPARRVDWRDIVNQRGWQLALS